MIKMDEREELRKEANKLQDKLTPIRDQIKEIDEAKDKKEREKQIGKCYLFRNSGGSGEWDLFIKVIGVTDSGLQMIKAQKTNYGSVEITNENQFGELIYEIEISNERFMKEFNALLKELKP